MARGDGIFARIDVDFILGDPRYTTLTTGGKSLYIGLWCLAVRQRSDKLPAWFTPKALSNLTGLDHRTTKKCLTLLQQKCLISIDPEGCVIVYGAGVKHSGLKNWGEAISSPNGENFVPTSEPLDGQSRVEKSIEEKNPPTPRKRGERKKIEYPPGFTEWWDVFDGWRAGSSKKATYDRWRRLIDQGEATASQLLTAVENYSDSKDAQGAYVSMSTSFLGVKRTWEGYLEDDGGSGWSPPTSGRGE